MKRRKGFAITNKVNIDKTKMLLMWNRTTSVSNLLYKGVVIGDINEFFVVVGVSNSSVFVLDLVLLV